MLQFIIIHGLQKGPWWEDFPAGRVEGKRCWGRGGEGGRVVTHLLPRSANESLGAGDSLETFF